MSGDPPGSLCEPGAPIAATESVAKLPRKPPKKASRTDLRPVVEKAHEAARKAIAPPPKPKPNKTASGKAADRGTLIKRLAAELKMDPFDLRVIIRSTGMRAPYEDEKKVRAAIKQGQKALKTVKK
jgi:hypothetical protein